MKDKPLLADEGAYAVKDEPAAVPPKASQPPPSPPEPLPPVAKSWDSLWPLATRLKAFAWLLVLDLVAAPLSWFIFGDILASIHTLLGTAILQAFLVGTFNRIDLTRSAKGKVGLARTWRIAFWPLKPKRIRWGEFESVNSGKSFDPRLEDWIMALFLLFYLLIPGILWYWYVVRPDRVHVALCKDHGFTDTILYRGTDEAKADEIAKAIADVTGLPYTWAACGLARGVS